MGGGRLTQQRQVAGEPLGVIALDAPQAVEVGGNLLVIVENPGDVGAQRGLVAGTEESANLARERERRRAPSKHVDRPAPPQNRGPVAFLEATGNVVSDGNGIEVPGENHALVEAETGPRAHGIPVAQDLQGRDRPESGASQGLFNAVSQWALISRHRGDVDHLARQLNGIHHVRQLHGSSFVDASRIPAPSPTCVFPPLHQGTPTPRS